jgi:hypothetical protein
MLSILKVHIPNPPIIKTAGFCPGATSEDIMVGAQGRRSKDSAQTAPYESIDVAVRRLCVVISISGAGDERC